MNTVPASFIAMVVAWALPICAMAVGQLLTAGRTSDVAVMASWVGLFTLVAWVVAVLPVMLYFRGKRIFTDLRFSWLGWSALAVVLYVLVVVMPLGHELLIIIWYPAVMGSIGGVVFALLVRRKGEKQADSLQED